MLEVAGLKLTRSFSMPSSSHPELAEKGAWSADERRSAKGVMFAVKSGSDLYEA